MKLNEYIDIIEKETRWNSHFPQQCRERILSAAGHMRGAIAARDLDISKVEALKNEVERRISGGANSVEHLEYVYCELLKILNQVPPPWMEKTLKSK